MTIKNLNISKKTIVLNNEPFTKHTTFGVGGKAKLFILPNSLDDIIEIPVKKKRTYKRKKKKLNY